MTTPEEPESRGRFSPEDWEFSPRRHVEFHAATRGKKVPRNLSRLCRYHLCDQSFSLSGFDTRSSRKYKSCVLEREGQITRE